MKLPLLISNPHAGLSVPPEVKGSCVLTEREIVEDGDEGAAEIYNVESEVRTFLSTNIARAIVDLNRPENDRSPDGVVKTHTCWNVPVYREFPSEDIIQTLLQRYYRPYHTCLGRMTPSSGIRLALDCHTMAAIGPPMGPLAGQERPLICLSNADGTCPPSWIESLAECFERAFRSPVSINHPFKGGYIIRRHSAELPWVQLEMSRTPLLTNQEKRERALAALADWCRHPLEDCGSG